MGNIKYRGRPVPYIGPEVMSTLTTAAQKTRPVEEKAQPFPPHTLFESYNFSESLFRS